MSSTNRGSKRNLDDHYATPPDLCELVCETLKRNHINKPQTILEPGCGEGFFLDAFEKVWPSATCKGIELNKELVDLSRKKGHNVIMADVLNIDINKQDAIIGNPPFKHADEFIRKLLPNLNEDGCLAFLLRLNFLGGQKRFRELWSQSKYQPNFIYVLPARPGFTPDGRTDSIEYMVCVWQKGNDDPTIIQHLDNTMLNNKWKGEIMLTREHGHED